MKNRMRRISMLVLVVVMFFSAFSVGVRAAEARKSLSYKWGNKYSTVYFYCGFNDLWRSAIGAGMSSWNSVKELSTGNNTVPMSFTANSSHSNKIYSTSGETWLGKTFPTHSNGTLTAVSIAFNSGTYKFTVGASAGKFDIQTVATHELGHSIGIAHCHEMYETCFSNTCLSNVMMPAAVENSTRRNLTSYDIASKQLIY